MTQSREEVDTYINFVLDRSGSMHQIEDDTIGGFNSFINQQKENVTKDYDILDNDGNSIKQKNNIYFSLIQFDHEYNINYKNKSILEVEELNRNTFVPRGQTALLDALGMTIKTIKKEKEGDNIIVVILTDGEENCSKEYSKEQINNLITEKRKEGIEFVFLGANQDAIKSANHLGISQNSAMTYSANKKNVNACFRGLSDAVERSYSTPHGAKRCINFTQEERSMSSDII